MYKTIKKLRNDLKREHKKGSKIKNKIKLNKLRFLKKYDWINFLIFVIVINFLFNLIFKSFQDLFFISLSQLLRANNLMVFLRPLIAVFMIYFTFNFLYYLFGYVLFTKNVLTGRRFFYGFLVYALIYSLLFSVIYLAKILIPSDFIKQFLYWTFIISLVDSVGIIILISFVENFRVKVLWTFFYWIVGFNLRFLSVFKMFFQKSSFTFLPILYDFVFFSIGFMIIKFLYGDKENFKNDKRKKRG